MNCMGCVYAKWDRTSNGRLHPQKGGRCTYHQEVPLPRFRSYISLATGRDTVVVNGSFIERGYEFDQCLTRKEMESENG